MSEDTFSSEYFRHLLTSLTLNSRALIVELTNLAEKFVDNAQEIVELIEERINKILPKYKLYSFYLMDSIIKNIGNPYNLLFATNLHKNFTETYLIVDDTPTRQNMINLFKTWVSGKTSAGSDLFPKETLLKVERFIIQATSLNTSVPAEGPRVTRDMILREGNYLLQYVIALDEDLDRYLESSASLGEMSTTLKSRRLTRNNLISDINLISESAMVESREEFETKKESFIQRLREIRKVLDEEGQKQNDIFGSSRQLNVSPKEATSEPMIIQLNLTARKIDILSVVGEKRDPTFEEAMKNWGKAHVPNDSPRMQIETSITQSTLSRELIDSGMSLASTLGLNLDSIDLQTLGNEDHVSELMVNSSGASMEDEADGYDPEITLNESEIKHSPPTSPISGMLIPGKSSLKRPHSGEERTAKRVRFVL